MPDVVGYRIANPGIEGEYFPTETNTPEDYLKQFYSDFGTYPQISGLLVPTQVDKSGVAKALAEQAIPTGMPAYSAKSSGQGKLWDSLRASEKAASTEESKEAASKSANTLSGTTDWRPYYSKIWTSYNGTQRLIQSEYTWNKANESLQAVPLNWGLEFEVNLSYTEDRVNGIRPFCVKDDQPWPIVSERFWAMNKNWSSWAAYYQTGIPNANIQAYADLNDLSDLCTRQSLAIGVGAPRNVTGALANNQQSIGFQIIAPGGSSWVNQTTGVVQAVEHSSCDYGWGGIAHTDCMGINYTTPYPGPGDSFFITLSGTGAGNQANPTLRKPVYTPDACWTLVKNQVPYQYPCWMQGYPS